MYYFQYSWKCIQTNSTSAIGGNNLYRFDNLLVHNNNRKTNEGNTMAATSLQRHAVAVCAAIVFLFLGAFPLQAENWTQMESGTNTDLYEVGGGSGDDVFAVGDGGTILHYDGTGWSSMASGTTVSLSGVWGSAPDNVFAVGDGGTILHYDGTGWSSIASGTTADLRTVWGASASDVFAGGTDSTILYYNGSRWAPTPTPSGIPASITQLWGTNASNVYAAGLLYGARLWHFNGSA